METIKVTAEEKAAIIDWLENKLRDYYYSMSQQEADTLNGLYFKLTGKNHETWESRGGKYGKG